MKPAFLSLLIACCVTHVCSTNAMAQGCPNFINENKDSAFALIKQADQYFGSAMLQNADTTSKEYYLISSDLYTFKIVLNKKTELVGASPVKSYTTVKHIYIKAPAEKLQKFYDEIFLPSISACIKKKQAAWVYYNNTMVVLTGAGTYEGVGLKSLDVEYREKM